MERSLKQFLFGLLYLAFLAIIFFVFFAVASPKPSCGDGKKNQNEEEIDCGGPCSPCIKGANLLIKQSASFPIQSGNRTSFFLEVRNSSPEFWVSSFHYTINIYNILGAKAYVANGDSSVAPGGSRKIIVVGANIDQRDIYKIVPEISNVKWASTRQFVPEAIRLDQVVTEKMSDRTVRVRGVIRNDGPDLKTKIAIGAILKDGSGKAVNVSSTTVENLSGFSNKSFEIFFPEGEQSYDLTETEVFFETTGL